MALVFSGARDLPTDYFKVTRGRRSCNRENLYDGVFNRSIKTVLEYEMRPRERSIREDVRAAYAAAPSRDRNLRAYFRAVQKAPQISPSENVKNVLYDGENSALLTTAIFFDTPIHRQSCEIDAYLWCSRRRRE